MAVGERAALSCRHCAGRSLRSGWSHLRIVLVRQPTGRSHRHVLVLRHVPVVKEHRDDEDDAGEVEQERRGWVDLMLARYADQTLGSLDALTVVVDRQQ